MPMSDDAQHLDHNLTYKPFPSPVRVKSSDATVIIESAWDAVEYLGRWPGTHCSRYRIAVQHCKDAVDGLRCPSIASKSFISAARHADLLV
ncbi:DUF982 domain-containing protein [Oryzifoliimicrobium ureilyticus]|uniref:DUF982 domain-containing protein n=1 Tax=Oryzifoliimicrobium ureilyticus TaxID=3113724 RepID=UPI003F661A83